MTDTNAPAPAAMVGEEEVARLLARVEHGTGADHELGRAVLVACGWRKTVIGRFHGPIYYWSSPDGEEGFNDDDFYRRDPTWSLDAVVSLVETTLPRETANLLREGISALGKKHFWHCEFPKPGQIRELPRAVLAAFLRALETKARQLVSDPKP